MRKMMFRQRTCSSVGITATHSGSRSENNKMEYKTICEILRQNQLGYILKVGNCFSEPLQTAVLINDSEVDEWQMRENLKM